MSERTEYVPSAAMPDKYDRTLGQLDGLPGMLHSKPTTLRVTPPLGIGGSSTYVITTYRQAGDAIEQPDGKITRSPATFTVFLEIVDGDKATRIVLPHDVAQLIDRQRDALTAQANRRSAKQAAATRKARGYVSTPPRRKAAK